MRDHSSTKRAPVNMVDLAWLAGILEGEGSFVGGREGGGTRLRITMNSTDRDVIERAAAIAGGNIYGPYESTGLGSKQVYGWAIGQRQHALALMLALRPFMCERRRGQIDAAIAVAGKPAARRPAPTKPCQNCGRLFKKGTRSRESWERASACSPQCSGVLRRKRPYGQPDDSLFAVWSDT